MEFLSSPEVWISLLTLTSLEIVLGFLFTVVVPNVVI